MTIIIMMLMTKMMLVMMLLMLLMLMLMLMLTVMLMMGEMENLHSRHVTILDQALLKICVAQSYQPFPLIFVCRPWTLIRDIITLMTTGG